MAKMEEKFTDTDIEEAYKKFKTYFYYDNSNLFMRRKIAEFETNENFKKN